MPGNASDFHPLSRYLRVTPEKRAAYRIFKKAIRDGLLTREPCSVCGTSDRVHGHHLDYSKPTDVLWLCPQYHYEWHSKHGYGLNGGDDEDERNPYPARVQLAGRRFGALTVLREMPARNRNHSVVWLCECDCGVKVARSTGSLVNAGEQGNLSSCKRCRIARHNVRFKCRRDDAMKAMLGGFGLYSTRAINILTDDIREALTEELGFAPTAILDKSVSFTSSLSYDWGSAAIAENLDSPEIWTAKVKISKRARLRSKRAGQKSGELRAAKRKAA